jgi:hypothetical protein
VFAGVDNAYVSYVPVQKNTKTGKNIRPAERGMLKYIDYMVNEAGFLERGDFLIFDGERSFSTATVKALMVSYGIVPFVIKPSLLHQLLSPADNNFHATFKLAYYRGI